MKKQPDSTTPKTPKQTSVTINTSTMMDVFSEDTTIMDNIQSNMSALYEILDTNYIKQAEQCIDKHQWHNAKHLLSKVSDSSASEQLTQTVKNEIDIQNNLMKDTISELYGIWYAYGSGCKIIQAYPEENVCIYLSDYGLDTWAGMEYGKIIGIWHNGMIHKKKFTRRDGFTGEKDRPEYAFNDIAHVDIQKNTDNLIITVTAQQGKYEENIVFEIPVQETKNQKRLTAEEQNMFKDNINHQTEILLQQHFREHAKMPMSINFRFDPTVTRLPPEAMEQQVPYEKPYIMDRYTNHCTGEAVIILKAQIDHNAIDGKQYERVGYTINYQEEPKEVFRECRYESQIRHWDIITTRAEDFL